MNRFAPLVVGFALVIAQAASAASPAGSYLDLAREAWNGQTPTCGAPRMYDVSDWNASTGPMEHGLPPATVAMATTDYGECGVLWDRYNRWHLTDYGWCAVIVHEYGHLLGREHNRNKRSVMYEEGPWTAHVPVCDQFRPPGGCTAEVMLREQVHISLCGHPRRRDERRHQSTALARSTGT